MNPLIDSALEKVDKQHAQLTQLSSDAVDALNLYHMLMRSNVPTTFNAPKIPYSYPQQLPSQVATHDATQGPPTGNLPSSVLPQGLTPTLANSVYVSHLTDNLSNYCKIHYHFQQILRNKLEFSTFNIFSSQALRAVFKSNAY